MAKFRTSVQGPPRHCLDPNPLPLNSGFKISGLGFRVYDFEFRILGSGRPVVLKKAFIGFRIWSLRFKI